MFIYSFLFAVFAFLFLIHWAIYAFLVFIFSIERADLKIFLVIFLLFLAASFIVSVLLVHWHENFFTVAYYFFSGVWFGFVINLLSAIVIFIVFYFSLNFFGKSASPLLLGLIFVFLSIFYTGLGVYNVFHPKITNISIKIKNLPSEWDGKRVVQISDLHLGRILGVGFLDKIISKIEKEKPEAIFITGDLFDGMDGGLDKFLPLLSKIKAPKGVFYVTGNHDIYLGLEKSLNTLKQTKINVLNDEIVEIDGLNIVGIGYPVSGEKKDIKKIIGESVNFSPDKPNILLFHSPINIFSDSDGDKNWHNNIYFSPDINFQAVKDLGIKLQLSGHTHKGQFFPFNIITHFIFKGYDYGLHTEDDFNIFTSSGVGVWGPTIRTGSRSEIVVIEFLKK